MQMEVQQASIVPGVSSNTFSNFLAALATFFFINVTWVFFRAADFTSAWRMLNSMFGQADKGAVVLPTLDIIKISTVILLTIFFHWFLRNTSVLQVAGKMRWWIVGIIWAFLLIAVIVSQKSGDSFIYFQF